MKLIKSRQTYKCYSCKTKINKGDKYARKSITFGQPWKPDEIVKKNGTTYFEAQGFRTTEPICVACAT
jgi:transposase-like protein